MERLMSATKALYNDFYKNGELLNEPNGITGSNKLSKEALSFLKDYISFLMKSKAISENTKIYFQSPVNYSAQKAFALYNQNNPNDRVNIHTALSSLDYDRKKLLGYFPTEMLTSVILSRREDELASYVMKLNTLKMKYTKSSTLDSGLSIRLPVLAEKVEITDDELTEFMKAIAPFIRVKHAEYEQEIASQFDKVIKYLGYLETAENLEEWDKDNLETIRDYIKGTLVFTEQDWYEKYVDYGD